MKKFDFNNTFIYVIASPAKGGTKQSMRLQRSLRRSAPRDDYKVSFLQVAH